MPSINIKSLPFERPLDISITIKEISGDFSEDTNVDLEHVTVTWVFLDPGHYAVGGLVAQQQPPDTHPVLVDITAPDFNTDAHIVKMLQSVSNSISKRANISVENIFINYRPASSGKVFDAGKLIRW